MDQTSGPERRTQAQRREQSGLGLVQAAIAVMARNGVAAATFEAIGRESGYSRSLVTQRFGARKGLIDAVIGQTRDSFQARLTAHGIDALPGLDALLAYMDLYLTELAEEGALRAYFMLLSSAVADLTELREIYALEHERVRQLLAALVVRGQAEGNVRREIDADAAALMIGSMQLGLSMQLLVDPTMDLEPIRATTLGTLRLSFAA